MISSLKAEFMADPLKFTGYLAHARLSDCHLRNRFVVRYLVSERGGSNSRESLSEGGGMLGGEVPGQSHRGQNNHHEHQKDVTLVHDDQILA